MSGADGALLVGVGPLDDVIVLHTHNRQSVKIARAHEGLDIADVTRREAWSELDDHPAAGEVEIERFGGIDYPPVTSRRMGKDFGHAERGNWRRQTGLSDGGHGNGDPGGAIYCCVTADDDASNAGSPEMSA